MRTMGRAEQQAIDYAAAEELGLSTFVLMEHAAGAIVRELLDMKATRVSFVCGRGNNGGDAYAAARLLLDHVDEVRVFEEEEVASRLSHEAALNREILLKLGLTLQHFPQYESREGEIVVDALLGTAFLLERGMPEPYQMILNRITKAKKAGQIRVLAVDLPSGVEADSGRVHPASVRADRTLSFIYPKTGIIGYPGRKYAGEIHLDSIGLPASWIDQIWGQNDFGAAVALDPDEFRDNAKREADSHKGDNGRVSLMAGSPGMGGAAILACRAAISGGSGFVRLIIPESLYASALVAVPSVLIETVPETLETQVAWWRDKIVGQDAVAIGPGIGNTAENGHRLFEFIAEAILTAPRLLLDADALNILAKPEFLDWSRAVLRLRQQNGLEPAVLTPHPGEAKRLLAEDAELVSNDRIAACL